MTLPPSIDDPPFDPDYDLPPSETRAGVEPRPPASSNGHHPLTVHDAAQQAEQAILGALLLTPEIAAAHADLLAEADFQQPANGTIWHAITTLAAQGLVPDHPTVVAHLARTDQLKTARGHDYLLALRDRAGIPGQLEHYADTIRDAAGLRAVENRLIAMRQRIATATPGELKNALADLSDLADHAATNFGPTPGQNPSTSWAPVDLTRVLAGEHLDPPPTMLRRTDGQPLLYDGAVHTISGESESGKTWLTLIAALQLIQASEHVVFLDFEDRADRVVGRLLALGARIEQIRDHFSYVRPDRPLDEEGRAHLQPHLADTRLVIVDGVTEAMTMHGFDLNSNADSAHFQGLLPRWIADHGPAVAMIDHVVKDKEAQGRFALGAQHKLAGIDGVAYIVKMIQPFARGKRGLARVDIAKDRPGHVREFAHGKTIAEFTLDATASDVILTAHLMPPGDVTGRSGDTFEPTVLMEKISRYVQLNPGMSKKAIEGAMNGKATTIRLALELLISHGNVGVKTGPRGAVQHFHIKAFYAGDDPENTEETGEQDTTESRTA